MDDTKEIAALQRAIDRNQRRIALLSTLLASEAWTDQHGFAEATKAVLDKLFTRLEEQQVRLMRVDSSYNP